MPCQHPLIHQQTKDHLQPKKKRACAHPPQNLLNTFVVEKSTLHCIANYWCLIVEEWGEHGHLCETQQFSHSVTLKVISPLLLLRVLLLCLWNNMGSLWWLIEHLQSPKALIKDWSLMDQSICLCAGGCHILLHFCVCISSVKNLCKHQIQETATYFVQNSRHAVSILMFSSH